MKRLNYLLVIAVLLSVGATRSIAPYPNAPACPPKSNTAFHKLWDWTRGCHYDHEHGDNPFTPAVAAQFPGVDFRADLGGREIGHDYMTSIEENTTKHGGFKWQVNVPATPYAPGFEGATYGVRASVVLYHTFGDYNHELEHRFHSTAAWVEQYNPAAPNDPGWVHTIQVQDYGQRVVPYQGRVLIFPDSPSPAYDSGLGPYWSLDCEYPNFPGCRTRWQDVLAGNYNNNETITSKGGRTGAQNVFNLLIRVSDAYQLLDSRDAAYPFTYDYVCGGATYNPVGCRYNNSAGEVHEIAGTVPASLDNTAGDSDRRTGRITGEFMVNGYPVRYTQAYVGKWGANMCPNGAKCSNTTAITNPDRDIYFNGVPSGWIGPNN